MKKILIFIFIILLALCLIGWFWWMRNNQKPSHPDTQNSIVPKVKYYTCSMHPWVRSNEPGNCPVCGMTLVPVYEDLGIKSSETKAHIHSSISQGLAEETQTPSETGRVPIHLSLEKQQRIGVRTEIVRRKSLIREIHTTGRVAYHPDLLVAQNEYLIALKTERMTDSNLSNLQMELVQATKTRLKLLGMSEAQIQDLAKKGKPQAGLILPKAGEEVWIYGSVYENELVWVKVGDTVQVSIPAMFEPVSSSIESINPTIDPMTRTVQIMLKIQNISQELKPDLFIKLVIQARADSVLAIPSNAVLSTGIRHLVFVDQGEGRFEPRLLKIGRRGSDDVEVLSGVAEGEWVVTSANFLIDSESQLKAVISEMKDHAH